MMPGFGWGGCCGLGGYGSFGLIGGIIGLAVTIAILVGLVVLVVWAVRRMTSSQQGFLPPMSQNANQLTAGEILAQRYARGEITREQYKQMLEDIR
jgi:putative membrane protein